MFEASELFDLGQTEHGPIFDGCCYAWEVLPKLAAFLAAHLHPSLHNRCEGRAFIGDKVYIGEGTVVEDGVMIKGPAIIGRNCQIRHNAYIRENVLPSSLIKPRRRILITWAIPFSATRRIWEPG